MRTTPNNRRRAFTVLGGIAALLMLLCLGNGSGSAGTAPASQPQASAVPVTPHAVAPAPSVVLPATATPPTVIRPAAPPPPKAAAAPRLSADDASAINTVKTIWGILVDATPGFSKAQHAMPPVVTVASVSGCPLGAHNAAPKATMAVLRYCNGALQVVTAKFLGTFDIEQLRAGTAAYLYHAYAHATTAQRTYYDGRKRPADILLGNLQAFITQGLQGNGSQEADTWVVVTDGLLAHGRSGSVQDGYNSVVYG